MAVWTGFGINYGHKGGVMDASKQADLDYLWSIGVRKIRIAYPTFNRTNLNINSKNLVIAALNKGFYVIWGVTAGASVTATSWADYKDYVLNNIAPWAQALNNSNLQLSIGNEEEIHIDGTTITESTLITDLSGAFGSSVQISYTKGPVSYETSALYRGAWATNGIGALDKVGFNVYYENSPTGTFLASVRNISTITFPGAYISEWNTTSGFNDAMSSSSNPEQWWQDNLKQRYDIIKSFGRDAYFFSFEDGGFGVPANSFGIRKTDGTYRLAWHALLGNRRSITL